MKKETAEFTLMAQFLVQKNIEKIQIR